MRSGKAIYDPKIRYTDEPLGRLKVVRDFLPRPEGLVVREEGVKVTIASCKRSVEFFKGEATANHALNADARPDGARRLARAPWASGLREILPFDLT
ncbi:MAG: hypothetical protein HYR50_10545 [Candidatus Rokubacteria bacterium]|nr:hypothetical protein [Candidatus Rokubacteria bacterium]